MKIVFPIYRFNWYRAVAPVIEECLKRGHEVECWHNQLSSQYASNRPSAESMPRFDYGQPQVRDYHSFDELDEFMVGCEADVVVSIDLPMERWIEKSDWESRQFRYVTIATTDTLRRLLNPEMLDATDLITVRSEREREACIEDHTTDYRPWVERARREGGDGRRFIPLVKDRVGQEWSDEMVENFRRKVRVSGYPFLDALVRVDRAEVRRRWGIGPDEPVVGFWSTPTQGRGFHGNWDRLFAEKNRLSFRYRSLRAYGLSGLKKPYCNERQILRSVQKFARHNEAVLVTKLRHYQERGTSLYSQFTDRVVGEDSYYPHTAFELSAIADVMIGFHTTGMAEAVFAGAPVINLVIPGFPQELHMNTLHYFDGMYDHPGIVTRLPVPEAVQSLPRMRLSEVPRDESARRNYLKRYCGPTAGPYSPSVVDGIESLFA